MTLHTSSSSSPLNMRIVVMGVSGTGKSTVGAALAQRLGVRYIEGDQYHFEENLLKMGKGIPLTDEDRQGWLLVLQSQLRAAAEAGESVVMTCSALKRSYRELLREADAQLLFIYLVGTREEIAARMHQRTGHFMPPSLMESQFRDLEPPSPDERAYVFSIDMPLEQLVNRIISEMQA